MLLESQNALLGHTLGIPFETKHHTVIYLFCTPWPVEDTIFLKLSYEPEVTLLQCPGLYGDPVAINAPFTLFFLFQQVTGRRTN